MPTVAAWRNWVWDSIITSTNAYEADAPITNLKTEQLGELARVVDNSGPQLEIDLQVPRPVRMVALLNHNIPLGANLSITLFDASMNPLADLFDPEIWIPPNDGFLQNRYFFFPSTVHNVRYVTVVSLWPYAFPFQGGGLWISPTFDLLIDPRFTIIVGEVLQSLTTDANQTRANPQTRFRTLQVTYNGLTEADAAGIMPDGTRKPTPYANIQDMFAYACNSRPVILIPDLSSIERMHKYGVYGYLQGQLPINLNQTSGDLVPDRNSTSITVKESS